MKKTLLIIVIAIMSLSVEAQLDLEQTYHFSGTQIEIEENVFKYFVMDVPLKQCRIYNEDHSIYKTINLSVPSGYYLHDVKFVTKHLFNNDDYVELLYIYSKSQIVNANLVYSYGLRVVNELGTVLLNLTDGGHAELKEGSTTKKLLTYQYIYYEGYYLVYTNVYTIGGGTKSASAIVDNEINLYPNPASENITVTFSPWEQINEGQMMITDMSGRIVSREPILPGSHQKRIETSQFSSGVYVLSILSNKKIITSEKFEIK